MQEQKAVREAQLAEDRGKCAIKAEMAIKDRDRFEKEMKQAKTKQNLDRIKKRG